MSSENVVDPEERMKCLIATRNLKMAASAHAYVRGMYDAILRMA